MAPQLKTLTASAAPERVYALAPPPKLRNPRTAVPVFTPEGRAERDLLARLRGEDEAKLERLRGALPGCVEEAVRMKGDAEGGRRILAEAEWDRFTPVWAEVAKLDREIAVTRDGVAQRTDARQRAEATLRTLRKDLTEKEELLGRHRAAFQELDTWLRERVEDGLIVDGLPNLRSLLDQWREQGARSAETQKELAGLEESLSESGAQVAQAAGCSRSGEGGQGENRVCSGRSAPFHRDDQRGAQSGPMGAGTGCRAGAAGACA